MLKPILNLLVFLFVPILAPSPIFNVYLTFLAEFFTEVNFAFILLLIIGGVLVGAFLSIVAYENFVFKSKFLATLIIGLLSSVVIFGGLSLDFPKTISFTLGVSYFIAFGVTAFLWNKSASKETNET